MGTCCSNEVILYVDGSYVCMNCAKDRTGEMLLLNGFDFAEDLSQFVDKSEAECECGSNKTPNHNLHTFWCPKYSKT